MISLIAELTYLAVFSLESITTDTCRHTIDCLAASHGATSSNTICCNIMKTQNESYGINMSSLKPAQACMNVSLKQFQR